ncbi:MAG: type II secretion system F family protein [Caulobacterales bacterium]|uniref:type II secretion system F family protein n=1 Tax=Glycocaulis sp. TaxID=1969725 RepID=UPI003F9F81FC
MATFRYRGLDPAGVTVEGRIAALDSVDAQKQLENQSIAPFELTEVRPDARKFTRNRARPADRQRFIRQLAVLIRAGTALLPAIDSLIADETCRELAMEGENIRRDLRSGARLSEAMMRHMPRLPSYAPRLVELGETTGQQARALNDIAAQMEQDLKAAAEVRNALAYPAFLAFAGLTAIIFIFMFVVPRFATLIGDDRSAMPAFSRWLIETSLLLRENALAVAVIAGLAVLAIVMLLRNPAARAAGYRLLESVPVISTFLRASDIARWARITGTALSGGSGLVEALQLAESAVSSRTRRIGLQEARRAIRSGDAIDVALRTHTDFDAMSLNLIKTGRSSASLDEMLLFLAGIYEDDSRNRAKQVTALAEPLAIVFIAGVIGAIVVGLVLAMTSMYDIAI